MDLPSEFVDEILEYNTIQYNTNPLFKHESRVLLLCRTLLSSAFLFLFIMLCKVVLTFEFVDLILWCDLIQIKPTELFRSYRVVCNAVQVGSNFRVCR